MIISNQAIKSLNLKPCLPAHSARIRNELNRLWPEFTRHIDEEMFNRGRCGLRIEPAGKDLRLFIITADGQKVGAVSDPLGIAKSMVEKGRMEIVFRRIGGELPESALIDKTLLGILGEKIMSDLSPGPQALDDWFIPGFDVNGLPVLRGVTYIGFEEKAREAALRANERLVLNLARQLAPPGKRHD